MSTPPLLAARGIGKQFGDRVAVRDVSLDLHRGETIALLGPNGAGKTTTLRLLAGLLLPTTGTVEFDGTAQSRESWRRTRSRIGFLTEQPGLWDRLTVEANLLIHGRLHGVADARRRIRDRLGQLDLADRATDPAGSLSKGMRQKVALARALLHDPEVVLLDEPTAGLDPAMTRTMRDVMRGLRERGCGVLVSTHNLDEAERLADRVAVLQQTLVAFDTPSALRKQTQGGRVRIVTRLPIGQLIDVARRAGAREVAPDGDAFECTLDDPDRDVPGLVKAMVDAGAPIRAVIPIQRSLEEAYLAVTRASPSGGAVSGEGQGT